MSDEPSLFFYCYDHDRPTGGQKDTYLHVDVLAKAGYKAFVVHTQENFRLTWFENRTPVKSMNEFACDFNRTRDYLVLPEDLGSRILRFPGNKKIIFNKGIFNGFRGFRFHEEDLYPYNSPDIIAALAISEHNAIHLKYAFPHLTVLRVIPQIDEHLFSRVPLDGKKRQIVYVPKALGSLSTLCHTLWSRSALGLNQLDKWKFIFLQGMSQAETIILLQESLIVVFLNIEEGLPRTPLEAMCCGCLVAGFDGGPLLEALPPYARFATGNLINIANFIEQVAASYPRKISDWQYLADRGHEWALSFSVEKHKQSVLSAWAAIIGG